MMPLFVVIIALLVLTPDFAWGEGFRGRGGFRNMGAPGHRGPASTLRPNFGKSRRSFSRPRIVVPHPPAASFHSRRHSFGRFTAPRRVLRQVHPPFVYYDDTYHFRPYVGGYLPRHGGVVIIEVPAQSGSMATTPVAPDLRAHPFAPAPLLGGLPVRTLPQQLAPFDPTPQEVVVRMLVLAGVTEGDIIYDLGSGDGRILIAAAKKYRVKAVGFEVDPGLVKLARENIKQEKLEDLVEIRQQDFMTADLSSATVVTLYLSQDGNQALKPLLKRQLRPGARVVSYTFDMGDWLPKIAESYRDVGGDTHALFLWETAQPRYSENPQ